MLFTLQRKFIVRNNYLFIFLFFALFCGVFMNAAFAADAEADPEEHLWHNCKKDTDCMYIGNDCFYGSINKKYKARGERFVREFYGHITCTGHPSLEEVKNEPYCKLPQIECKSRKARDRGEICFATEGKCAIKP